MAGKQQQGLAHHILHDLCLGAINSLRLQLLIKTISRQSQLSCRAAAEGVVCAGGHFRHRHSALSQWVSSFSLDQSSQGLQFPSQAVYPSWLQLCLFGIYNFTPNFRPQPLTPGLHALGDSQPVQVHATPPSHSLGC